MSRIAFAFSAWLGLTACFSTSLRAQEPVTQGQTTPAPAKVPATKAAPVLPPDTLGRYGKILTPSDQVAHPLKLKLPFPEAGEIKIPSQDELTKREKLEALAKLSDDEIHAQLEKWPAYGKMSLRDEGTFLQRIQDFRDYRTNVAKTKAHEMGLLTLLPDQQARFEKEYWDKRLKMDSDLAKQFEPILKAREQKLQDDLFREFSSASPGPMAQAPKPPIKTAASAPDPASSQPVAQTPR